MQQSHVRPTPSHAVLHSADHVRLIAAYLSITDLLVASALCRASHAVFDSDAVWHGRLSAVECVQRVGADVPVPASILLSLTQLAALPPLPSLTEAAALCLQAYGERQQPQQYGGLLSRLVDTVWRRSRCARITAIVHLPSTLLYHARVVQPDSQYPLDHTVAYVECSIAYSESERKWICGIVGDDHSGWGALNIDDNIGPHDELLSASSMSTARRSSKQRYIELLQCSEHEHNQCYRLLSPSTPVIWDRQHGFYGDAWPNANPQSLRYEPHLLPILSPRPLCAHCLSILAGCIRRASLSTRSALYQSVNNNAGSYSLRGITRINRTIYERHDSSSHCRLNIRRRQTTAAERVGQWMRRAAKEERRATWDELVERYEVVALYGSGSAVYGEERNVCWRCECGLTKSGKGLHDCRLTVEELTGR